MDHSCLANDVIGIAFLQIILVGWVFGMDRFFTCVDKMGMKLREGTKLYFKISLKYVCPLLMLILFIMNFIGYLSDYSTNYTIHEFYGTKNLTDVRKHVNCTALNMTYNSNNGKILELHDCMYEMQEIEWLSWMIQLFAVIFIPLIGGYEVFQNYKAGNPWKTLVTPKENWRPADEDYNPKEGLKNTFF